ncbi:MAG: RluA family pseudouridine synthase [Chitinophagales bacterium]|nr:RluA family pseudouridine synthase [Chitinophagaceae bacterium]MCB9063669.1 RluA family pseudouridine synthase [Chitinophagales bacterium]
MNIEILYEDDDLLIVNKPAGMLVIPDRFDEEQPSLNRLLAEKHGQHMFVVHRLDRGTSGVICFAKNEETHKYMSKLFQEHNVEKYYTGLVSGRVLTKEGTIDSGIMEHPTQRGKMVVNKKGKESLTDYKVLAEWPLYTLVEFRIHTGRTHQIRVHMQSIGHPIACDELYSDGKPFFLSNIKKKYVGSTKNEERPLLSRLALHASKLVFKKADGHEIVAEAELPKDIAACVNQLNKWAKPV